MKLRKTEMSQCVSNCFQYNALLWGSIELWVSGNTYTHTHTHTDTQIALSHSKIDACHAVYIG